MLKYLIIKTKILYDALIKKKEVVSLETHNTLSVQWISFIMLKQRYINKALFIYTIFKVNTKGSWEYHYFPGL